MLTILEKIEHCEKKVGSKDILLLLALSSKK